MPTPIIPKSEARINHNVVVGYAEIPAVDVHGVVGWALIDGTITFSEELAIKAAIKLDKVIRKNMTEISQLLVADGSLDPKKVIDGLDLFPEDVLG